MVDRNNNNLFITTEDGQKIYLHCWDDVYQPRGVVQIFHGMAEHGERYNDFAKFLNSKGYIVYADDHRGHGKTAGKVKELGYIGEDGFNKIVEDERFITNLIKEKHKKLPVIIFGHSFGSFIGQEYIIRYGNDIEGAILCGTAARNGLDVKLGKFLASIERKRHGERHKSKLMDSLSFNGYTKKIENSSSKFDWLSCDSNVVKKYEDDPYCGTLFTTGFFYYMLQGLSQLY